MKNRLFLLISLILLNICVHAQPSTDIILFDISYSDGELTLENPNWVTKRDGYDNQPHFDPKGEYLYYTSIREDGQADIYRYHLSTQQTERFTSTDSTSEYSATVMPDGKHISVIMVETDGQTQRLWKFPLKGGEPKLIMDKIQPVGYHSWMNKKELVMFILGDPPTLQWTHVKKQKPEILAEKIGRSIHKAPIPGTETVSFVIKETDENWGIFIYNSEQTLWTNPLKLVDCLEGSEDFCWAGENYLLMGKGNSLFLFDVKKGGDWKLVKDLSSGSISRLTVNNEGTKLAIVISPK